ncbi:MAG: ROK family transcriptional regulator [Clostridia bacterium]|nr:ROK family transcriptional regulator [Clostridia bacterium]
MKSYAKNVQSIKNDNRATILNLIRKAPVSRAEISAVAGLSKSSVTMITNALISEGQVREIGTEESTVGRKRILLDIVADYRFAAGIILHRRDIKVCLTDLKGEVITRASTAIENFRSADEVIDYTVNTVFELIDRLSLKKEDCIGIGISCPGPLDITRGVVLSPPHLDMLHNVAICDKIREKTGMNVSLENNAVLLAMRENLIRDKMQNFMSVIISHGIGSAVVTAGEIYRGALGFSGELGHISVVADGLRCPCGNCGCLERYVSLSALKEHFGFTDYKQKVDMAYEGDEEALSVLRYITTYLGSGLVSAVNLFDLDAVILHGDYSYRPELLNEMLKEYINKNSVVAAVHGVEVISSPERNDRAEGNSTAAIIEQYFDQILEG